MSQWKTVCAAEQLSEYLGVCVLLDGHQIALFRIKNQLFAVDNFDPFSGANVISRGIVGDLNGRLVVASPIYKQHFDLKTGQCLEDDNITINVLPVRLHGGFVQIMPLVIKEQVIG